MAAVLYLVVAGLLLWAAHHLIGRVPKPAALFLILLPLILTGPALLTGRLVAPVDFPYLWEPFSGHRAALGVGTIETLRWSDVASQLVPWRQAVRDAVFAGEWPLLNRYSLSGDILAASAQSAAFHPFTLLAILLPAADSFNFTASLTLFVAAAGAFIFGRHLGLSNFSALFAATAWTLSSPLAFFALWPIGAAWALLPLVLLATRRAVVSPGVRSALGLTAMLSLLILSGHPETLLHVVAVGFAYGLFELFSQPRRAPGLATAVAAGTLSLLITAIYLLPLIEAMAQTHERWIRTALYAKTHFEFDGVKVAVKAATSILPFLDGHEWRSQHPRTAGVDIPMTGSIVLSLAAYGVVRVKTRTTRFFALLLLVAGCAAFDIPPVSTLLHAVPLFDIALNQRLAFAASFALVLLAALALQDLQERGVDRLAGAIALAFFTLIAAGTVWMVRGDGIVGLNGDWRILAELVPAGGAAILLMMQSRAPSLPLLALTIVQRAALLAPLYPALPSHIAYPPLPLLAGLQATHEAPFRVVGAHLALVPNSSAMYRLEDVRGYQAMTLKRLVETYPLWCEPIHMWFNRVGDLERPFLSMMNVRYAIAPRWMGIPDGWREVKSDYDARLFENTRVLPRAFIPQRVRLGASDVVAEMSAERDFAQRAWIEAPSEPAERVNGPGAVTTKQANLAYDITANMQRDGWIVVSQAAWKGWRAYLDGRRVELQIANHAFLSIFVPAGRHHVRLVYRPESFVIGRAITFGTLLVLLGAFAARTLKWRNPPARFRRSL